MYVCIYACTQIPKHTHTRVCVYPYVRNICIPTHTCMCTLTQIYISPLTDLHPAQPKRKTGWAPSVPDVDLSVHTYVYIRSCFKCMCTRGCLHMQVYAGLPGYSSWLDLGTWSHSSLTSAGYQLWRPLTQLNESFQTFQPFFFFSWMLCF